jgi:hypothetical protein
MARKRLSAGQVHQHLKFSLLWNQQQVIWQSLRTLKKFKTLNLNISEGINYISYSNLFMSMNDFIFVSSALFSNSCYSSAILLIIEQIVIVPRYTISNRSLIECLIDYLSFVLCYMIKFKSIWFWFCFN